MGGFIQRTTMLLCISFGGLLALFSLADAAQFKLNVILKELDGSKPFDATVTIKAGEIAQQLTRKNTGQYAFEGDLGPTALDKYEVLVEPPPSHFARSVKAKAHKLSQSISSVLNLFITKDSDKFTYKYLDDGLKYFRLAQFDSALAHYELPFFKMKEADPTEYKIKLEWNYIRALHNTCLTLGYDTCAEAERIIELLMVFYISNKAIFEKLNIPTNGLTKAKLDLKVNEIIDTYSKMSELFKQARYLEAANLAEHAIDDFNKSPKAFTTAGITQDRVLTDAGVSYLKASEIAEKTGESDEKVQNLLTNARKFLVDVKSLDIETTKKNISVIDAKLGR